MKSQRELMLDQMYHSMSLLVGANQQIDRKLESLLTGGGLLALASGVLSSQAPGSWSVMMAVIAILFYGLTIGACVRAWSPRVSPYPKITDEGVLYGKYINSEQSAAYDRLLGTLANVVESYESINLDKADKLWWAAVFFVFQIGALMTSLVVPAMISLRAIP